MCYSLPMTTATAPLEAHICFAMYSASRSLTARYRELLAPLGITYPQYLALLVLWETGTITVSQLGERLFLDSGTLSPLLRRMEAAGLIAKSRSVDDERVVEVSLTDAGDAMRSEGPRIGEAICDATGLPLDELIALQRQIAVVAEHVRALA